MAPPLLFVREKGRSTTLYSFFYVWSLCVVVFFWNKSISWRAQRGGHALPVFSNPRGGNRNKVNNHNNFNRHEIFCFASEIDSAAVKS